jgi:hypothetical protein
MVSTRSIFFVACAALLSIQSALAIQSNPYGYKLGDGYYGPIDNGSYYAVAPQQRKGSPHQTAQSDVSQSSPQQQAAPVQSAPATVVAPTPPSAIVSAKPAATDNSEAQIVSLEQRLFSRTYDEDTDYARLSRLEQFVFGMPRPQRESLRIAALMKAFSDQSSIQGTAGTTATSTPNAPAKSTPSSSFTALMKAGRSEFGQNAFHAARDTFEQAMVQNPGDQDAHFWLAMSYWHLYDYENANTQLKIVFRLNPFSTEGQVAKQQMLDITRYLTASQTPAVDPPSVVMQSMAQMEGQAYSLQSQKLLDGELASDWRTQQAYDESYRIQRDTNFYLRSEWRQGRRYGYIPANLGEVSDLGYIRSHYVLTDGLAQAARAQQDAALRAGNVQDWENSLLSQMSQPARTGQPQLRAFGTNLYVQYYGNDDPSYQRPVAAADPPLLSEAMKYVVSREQTGR